jgi:hypothetical protein
MGSRPGCGKDDKEGRSERLIGRDKTDVG